ncbi:hypothetical protein MSG28_000905 [Choristoneura fumiferana]|uniref:Uncharacterized protein n=2 Tax=Choristoneura fumiferana TaxID=7141 RepID=A0ACC0K2K2_CHOFU|nr:hypothetical protein MSG28_000905 [Choristoneura fumiferana]
MEKQEGDLAFVSGWGRCDWSGKEFCLPRSSIYYPDEKVDPMLRTITFNIADHARNHFCVGYRKHGVQIRPGMLCAGTAREEEALAPCLAVPGAPLVVRGQLVGLQSWGFGCGYVHDLPLIYTHIAHYQSWIKHNIAMMTRIHASDFKEMFYATRAFLLEQWMSQTRKQETVGTFHGNHPLQMSLIDKKLIQLKGNITDFRDYIKNGTFRQEKLEMYEKIRNHLAHEHKIEEFSSYTLRTGQPFFKQYVKEEVDFS